MAVWMGWLLDAARMTGYPVIEVGGWRTRGHGGMRVVEGVCAHHTADGPSGNYPSLNIVTHGRAGLEGPLSQLGHGRDGTIYVIAAGKAWHAGASQWAGMWDLNDEFIGIEAESVGTRDDWTAAQRDAYPRLCAALLHYMRRPASRLAAHREIALPAGRKIDPSFWDMPAMRSRVAWLLDDPQHRIPRFANPAPVAPIRKEHNVLENHVIAPGRGVLRLNVSVSAASVALEAAWIIASVNGPGTGTATIWFQRDTAGISEVSHSIGFAEGRSEREVTQVPDGTTMVNIHYDFPDGGCITVEGKSK